MTTDKHDNPNEDTNAPSKSPRLRVPGRATTPPAARAGPEQEGEGGEGGDGPPPTVTNRAFLDAIFPALPEGARVLALAKPGDPRTGGWGGFDAREVEPRCRADTNNYFNCASFYPTEDGETRALEAKAAAYHCLILDDVGTKAALDALPPVEPTWMVETSPDNYQVGFRLTAPVADFAAVKAAQKRVLAAGFGDKGAAGVARWARLPNGSNGKLKHRDEQGQPFRCGLVSWNPDVSHYLEALAELFAPASADRPSAQGSAAQPHARPARSHPRISSDVFRPALPESAVVTVLKQAGLYKRQVTPGVHEVTCPWVDEHTDALDTGACYFEPSADHPLGGFKCHHQHGDKYRLGALLQRFELARRDVHNKPCIRIVEGELQSMVDAAQVVLARTGEFFQAGGLIKKVVVNPLTGQASAVTQTDADLTLALSSAADWERCESKNSTTAWRRCNPLPNCIRLLKEAQTYAHLPVLAGIARQPVIDADGKVISAAGYDAQSRLYCAFDPVKFARPAPTEANARVALGRLQHLLWEFRYATPRDGSTAVAAIFTAALRMGLGRAPGIHLRAPSPGSGKSLHCEVVSRFAGPGHPAKVSYPRTDDEATKVILAALLESPAVIDFDDMTIDWRPFGAVNRLLTSETMTDRVLGVSKMATVSTNTLVLGSGNNTGPTGDLIRRVIVIDLDPGEESPATMRYEGDPLRDVEANREAYVADVLTIVEAWIAAGSPKANVSPIATYGGRWSDFCRQPLVWLGLEDPASGLIEQLREDPERATLGRLLSAWHGERAEKPVTLRVLLADAEGDLVEAIEDLPFVEGGPVNRTKLGYYLKRNAGRPVDGLKLEKADSRERNAWRVVRVGAAVDRSAPATAAPPLPPLPPSVGPAAKVPSPRLKPPESR
ncbi:DNA-primase RepB domain-containing protein [Sphingomonas sp.]|uniref:DNA-primase RepB domain-containing protein n=1 Tax=Sphingomonas sp. TaxID=28214 RepID=UPI001822A3BB|nr:DNA-primase RepB domain-containing protein [Sphingomonas sp.]MBA3510452.1 hypothetical protein [Sphingomonas sp.]